MTEILDEARIGGQTLFLDFWYPRLEGNINEVELGLMDVRAADSIRISYDFDRDGYVIKQASIFEWAGDDEVCDMDWQEVAFIRAWGRERPTDPGTRPDLWSSDESGQKHEPR